MISDRPGLEGDVPSEGSVQMPLQRRKPTVRGAVRDVLAVPFALLILLLISVPISGVFVFGCWLLGADLSGEFPYRRFLLVGGMTLAVATIAAIPLGIIDYFFGNGDGWQWVPDEGSAEAGVRYADIILRSDVESLQPHLLPWLAASVDRTEMTAACASVVNAGARPVAVRSAVEVPLPEGEPEDFDSIVEVVVDGVDLAPCGMLEFWIDAAAGHQIVSWRYWRYPDGDPQRAVRIVQVAPRLDAAAV